MLHVTQLLSLYRFNHKVCLQYWLFRDFEHQPVWVWSVKGLDSRCDGLFPGLWGQAHCQVLLMGKQIGASLQTKQMVFSKWRIYISGKQDALGPLGGTFPLDKRDISQCTWVFDVPSRPG